MKLPKTGSSREDVLTRMRQMRAEDAKWKDGRTFSLVYFAGDDVSALLKDAYGEFMAGLRESSSDQQETLKSAAGHLSNAVECDPEFALAHATLSFVSMNIHFDRFRASGQ